MVIPITLVALLAHTSTSFIFTLMYNYATQKARYSENVVN